MGENERADDVGRRREIAVAYLYSRFGVFKGKSIRYPS